MSDPLDRKIGLRSVFYTKKDGGYYTWEAIMDRGGSAICAIRTYPNRNGGITIKEPIEFKHKGGHDAYFAKLNDAKLNDGYDKEIKKWDGPLRDVNIVLSEWYHNRMGVHEAVLSALEKMMGFHRSAFAFIGLDDSAPPTPSAPSVAYAASAAPVDKWAGLPTFAGSF